MIQKADSNTSTIHESDVESARLMLGFEKLQSLTLYSNQYLVSMKPYKCLMKACLTVKCIDIGRLVLLQFNLKEVLKKPYS